jgi:hypothetical protein
MQAEGREMIERDNLLASIATTTADYRAGEVAPPTPQHIEQWINQFHATVQVPILREIDHVLRKSYFNKGEVTRFLSNLVSNAKLVGDDPVSFWRGANFLNIQQGGSSQNDLLEIFDEALKKQLRLSIENCGKGGEVFLYIDDVIFTGGRVKSDLCSWIGSDAPVNATVHVIVIATHEGFYYNRDIIKKTAQESGKSIDFKWWCLATFENRKYYRNSSDILWPVTIPDDVATQAHVAGMAHQPILRAGGQIGEKAIYSSDEGRQLLEREFLKAGVKIRGMCPNLPVVERPLGHSSLETLGFGSTIVTFRNCPNNAPLAFWVGAPWYPLFPRKTNADSRMERLLKGLL